MPRGFFWFIRLPPDPASDATPIALFGPSLELLDVRLSRWPEVGLGGGTGTLESIWRVRQPIDHDLRFALARTRRSDAALVGVQHDASAEALWFPTSRWVVGEHVRLTMPVDRLADAGALGIAVVDARDAVVVPGPADGGPMPMTWDAGRILAVVSVN